LSILIAGAGPAGSRLAELLAINGISVTLVERLKNPEQNAFSSAVVPFSALKNELIPLESVSTYWKKWQIYDPSNNFHQWISDNKLGAVLDFAILRRKLWENAVNSGVEFLSGWNVKRVTCSDDFVDVDLYGPNSMFQQRRVLFVVDATGQHRSLIGSSQASSSYGRDKLLTGSGIEWILQGNSQTVQQWEQSISFFLGSKWIKNGYAWIFPMSSNRLKVGVCSLPQDKSGELINHRNLNDIKKLLQKLNLDALPVLDRHGGVIRSTIKRREPHFSGRIIGIGDTVSTANLLGGEGIRHALLSAMVLAPLLVEICCSSAKNDLLSSNILLQRYQTSLRKKLGWRWSVSNRVAKKTWWGLSDDIADKRLILLLNFLTSKASAEEISALLFDYRFERYGLRLLPYLIGWQ